MLFSWQGRVTTPQKIMCSILLELNPPKFLFTKKYLNLQIIEFFFYHVTHLPSILYQNFLVTKKKYSTRILRHIIYLLLDLLFYVINSLTFLIKFLNKLIE